MRFTPSLFTEFNQYTYNTIPARLQILFNKIEQKHYEELYEAEADGTASLQDDLNTVLEALREKNQSLNHLRYLWMALILSLAVEPTLEYYDPSNLLPKIVIEIIEKLLLKTIKSSSKSINTIPENLDKLINEIFKLHESYFHKKGVNYQTISEALDVFYNAMRVINYNLAVEAMLEILYDCLEGYAIFPGSYGRRELFNWWLLEVVPASYNLLPPKSFYVVEGIENEQEIKLRQTRLLHRISKEIQPDIQELMIKSQISHNNYSFTSLGKIRTDSFQDRQKNNNRLQLVELV